MDDFVMKNGRKSLDCDLSFCRVSPQKILARVHARELSFREIIES